jgi:hypothetical protein
MNEVNTQILFARYPRLYRGRFMPLENNLMQWGFTCGDGWFDLVDRLSAAIEAECQRLRESEGWDEADLPIATQVKEKFGTLRFRMRPTTSVIHSLVENAFAESENICERCGQLKVEGCSCDLP